MASITIDAPNGDRVNTLIAAATEAGYSANAAGVKAMVLDFLREKYRAQKQLEAQRSVQATVDTAVTSARTNAADIA